MNGVLGNFQRYRVTEKELTTTLSVNSKGEIYEE
jgi:hypothetical protein